MADIAVMSSGFSFPPSDEFLSGLVSVASSPVLSILTTIGNQSIIQSSKSAVSQTDIEIDGSVNFVDATEQAFTNLTNPAAVVGLSTRAPEIIASVDYVPLYTGITSDESDDNPSGGCNVDVYNTIYQNTLLESLTREAARNCLVKLLKNEDGKIDTAISEMTGLQNISSHSDLLSSFSKICAYSFYVRNCLEWDAPSLASSMSEMFNIFSSIRDLMGLDTLQEIIMPRGEGWHYPTTFQNFQGFDPTRVFDIDSFVELGTGELAYTEDEYNNSSSTKIIAQIVQDLRNSILYGSAIRNLDQDRDTSSTGFSPYTVFDESESGKFSSVISGLNSLNASQSQVTLGTSTSLEGTDLGAGDTEVTISTLDSSDFNLFLESLSGISFVERMTIICQIISRDISMSFMKRTSWVLSRVEKITGQSPGENPSVESIVDNIIGNIGGSLFTSSPASESIASLLNPAFGDDRILTFERFSIDSSFGSGISGFDSFAGDIVHQIQAFIEAGNVYGSWSSSSVQATYDLVQEFSFTKFATDWYNKTYEAAAVIPVLIGGASSSNNFFRSTCFVLTEYLSDNGFIDQSETFENFIHQYSNSEEDQEQADEYEYIRLGIFDLASTDSEVAYLLIKYLDLRFAVIRRIGQDPFLYSPSATGIENVFESDILSEEYSAFYAVAEELASKVINLSYSSGGSFDSSESSSTHTRYSSEYTMTDISVSNRGAEGDTDFSFFFGNILGADQFDIMKTPIGQSLTTLALDTDGKSPSIFDIPKRTLELFYHDFLNYDIADEGGEVSLTSDDISRLNSAQASFITEGVISQSPTQGLGAQATFLSEGDEASIVTDFRGYDDQLRRRAIAYILIDIIGSMGIVNPAEGTQASSGLSIFVSGDITDVSVESVEMNDPALFQGTLSATARGTSATSTFTKTLAASISVTTSCDLSLNIARATQLAIACKKYSLEGTTYQDEDYSENLEAVDTSISSVFGGDYDLSIEDDIKNINGYLIKEFSRTETLAHMLTSIAYGLTAVKGEVETSFTSGIGDFLEYASLAADNASSSGDAALSKSDALSAIISTAMFPETLAIVRNVYSKNSYVACAGFFDDDISQDGQQASSIDLLLPAGSVTPSNMLSQRIIPALKHLTAKGRSQENSPQQLGPTISALGDSSSDRMKILAIGLPVGLTQRLREEASNYSAAGAPFYESSSLITIRVYKKDLDRGDVVYVPKTFIFDTLVFLWSCLFGDNNENESVTSKVSESAEVDTGISMSVIEENGSSVDVSLSALKNIEASGFRAAMNKEFSSVSEFSDLYRGLHFDKHSADSPNVSAWTTHYIDEIFSDSADQIRKNHIQDVVLKHYLKTVAGLDVSETAFPLFTQGTSHLSTSDGAGLGTSLADFEYLDSCGANSGDSTDTGYDFTVTDLYETNTSILDYRTEILSILSYAIDNGIITDQDLDTDVSTNILAKVRESLLFSPEKYFNQVFLPRLFERTFCILIDPDGFDIDTEESADQFDDAQAVGTYVSDMYTLFVTAEITVGETSGDIYATGGSHGGG